MGGASVGLWCGPLVLYSLALLSGCEEAMVGNMCWAPGAMAPGLVSLSLSRSRSMSRRLSRGATPFFVCVWGNELCYDLSQVWSFFELC